MFQLILFAFTSFIPSDSLRMETINGKLYVVHQVDEKETLYSISKRYGATIPSILEQNPTADAGIEVGQILKVPYSPKPKVAAVVQTAEGNTIHKVVAKETLFSISRLYNVSMDDLKTWNNLKDYTLSVGQEIIVKKKPATETTVAKNVQVGSAKTHTVAAKETLFSIAKLYGMTVQQLKEWNNIQNSELKIGQVLTVSAPASSVIATSTSNTATVNPVVKADATITVAEGVAGSDEIRESGLAELIEGTEGNRKYLAQHPTIKPGTILKIRNLTTYQEVFVRVTGPASVSDPTTLIRISKSAYDRLGATEAKFRAEITYYK